MLRYLKLISLIVVIVNESSGKVLSSGLRATLEDCHEFPDLTLKKHLSEIYNFWNLQEYFEAVTEVIDELSATEKNLLESISVVLHPFVDNPNLDFHDLALVMQKFNRREIEILAFKLYELKRVMKKAGMFPENFETNGAHFEGKPICT